MATHWIKLKREIWLRCGGACEGCGCKLERGSAHLHHLTYIRRGKELQRDVLYLCLGCHGEKHPRHTFRSITAQRLVAASRRKAAPQKQRPPPPLSPKDAAYDRVQELLASRRAQRSNGGRMHPRRFAGRAPV